MNWSTDGGLSALGQGLSERAGPARAPGWALAGSAALHLGIVVLCLWSTGRAEEEVAAGASPVRTVVRWIQADAEPTAAQETTTTSVLTIDRPPTDGSHVADQAGIGTPGGPDPVASAAAIEESVSPAPVTMAAAVAPSNAAAVAAAAAPSGPPSVDSAGGTAATRPLFDGVDGYLPRKALSVPPAPKERIALAWPAGMAVIGRQAAVFTVFIDETGVVRRMVPDGPTLQPTLEAVARDTFGAAMFSPGLVDGRPVKAMIRVEVVFDASVPVAAAPGASLPAVVSRQNL